MKKLIFAAVLALGGFAAISINADNNVATDQAPCCAVEEPCTPAPCDTVPCYQAPCNPAPCDTVPCNPAPCNPGC